ncbi:hypothetical protein MVES1_003684 [Malassezia vespertilionis]|uniref:Uncharacterized protein n=1 Tax=Malassezia vespertilionis TaxID=2020962 RepID=A0A2N1J8I2_9BASI|nr:uncharacterized protein MVES1_003684 [Malassezia vespertilionis]PKI82867.1 hypothetical protein MVES_003246 [Malassezia vespertilionis]WFD08312.1 hypothetical protein MVES1_003684 [Malassezia vespertilionis]
MHRIRGFTKRGDRQGDSQLASPTLSTSPILRGSPSMPSIQFAGAEKASRSIRFGQAGAPSPALANGETRTADLVPSVPESAQKQKGLRRSMSEHQMDAPRVEKPRKSSADGAWPARRWRGILRSVSHGDEKAAEADDASTRAVKTRSPAPNATAPLSPSLVPSSQTWVRSTPSEPIWNRKHRYLRSTQRDADDPVVPVSLSPTAHTHEASTSAELRSSLPSPRPDGVQPRLLSAVPFKALGPAAQAPVHERSPSLKSTNSASKTPDDLAALASAAVGQESVSSDSEAVRNAMWLSEERERHVAYQARLTQALPQRRSAVFDDASDGQHIDFLDVEEGSMERRTARSDPPSSITGTELYHDPPGVSEMPHNPQDDPLKILHEEQERERALLERDAQLRHQELERERERRKRQERELQLQREKEERRREELRAAETEQEEQRKQMLQKESAIRERERRELLRQQEEIAERKREVVRQRKLRKVRDVKIRDMRNVHRERPKPAPEQRVLGRSEERAEAERAEAERIEAERVRLEREMCEAMERTEAKKRLVADSIEKERRMRLTAELRALEDAEAERVTAIRREALAWEQAEREKAERREAERRIKMQAEKVHEEKLELERIAHERREKERMAKLEAERLASEQAEQEQARKREIAARAERERVERIEREEQERLARKERSERLAREQKEAAEREREQEKRRADEAEQQRKAEYEHLEQERIMIEEKALKRAKREAEDEDRVVRTRARKNEEYDEDGESSVAASDLTSLVDDAESNISQLMHRKLEIISKRTSNLGLQGILARKVPAPAIPEDAVPDTNHAPRAPTLRFALTHPPEPVDEEGIQPHPGIPWINAAMRTSLLHAAPAPTRILLDAPDRAQGAVSGLLKVAADFVQSAGPTRVEPVGAHTDAVRYFDGFCMHGLANCDTPRSDASNCALGEPAIMRCLAARLDFSDIWHLASIARGARHVLTTPSFLDMLLQRYLGSIGYQSWPDDQDPLPISLYDCHAFLLYPIVKDELQMAGDAYLVGAHRLDRRIPRLARSTTRAYSKILARVRLQPNRSVPCGSARVDVRTGTSFAQRPLHPPYQAGRATVFRVWTPEDQGTDEFFGTELQRAERELFIAGIWRYLNRGDMVLNTAKCDQYNDARYIFNGESFMPLPATYDPIGHLPSFMNMLLYPPTLYHGVVRYSGTSPVIYLDILPWRAQIIRSAQLVRDNVETIGANGQQYRIAKWLYRAVFTIDMPATDAAFDEAPYGAHHDWNGTVVLEAEGTAEHARELIERCIAPNEPGSLRAALLDVCMSGANEHATVPEIEPYHDETPSSTYPWMLVRERSRAGFIWLSMT